jgi:Na+/proline symporter
MIALIALGLSYVTPSRLIFTIVSYVWAGIGCTFSVVILFSLFWKKFHGRAAIITIISGILFTILWISGGFEQHYKVTVPKIDILVNQQIISQDDVSNLLTLDEQRFVNATRFEKAIKEKIVLQGKENNLPKITSAFISKGVPARLTTFIFSLIVAILSTFFIPKSKNIRI